MFIMRVTDGWHTSIVGPFDTVNDALEFKKQHVPEPFVCVAHVVETPEDFANAAGVGLPIIKREENQHHET